ncbi:hypothetical protein DITRI_Ditri04bG0099400 [Diplodiscus trichospermus]
MFASHTASIAAGYYHTPVIANGFNYGHASGMAPGARIAVYKALYTFGGYMSDVVAAVDQAVEDGVDILSLSVGVSSVPPGLSAVLNVLDMELLFATKAGVLVVQAAGNGGPSTSSVISISPWITSVAASITDRKYNTTILLGNGQSFSGTGLARNLFPKFQITFWSFRHTSIPYFNLPSFNLWYMELIFKLTIKSAAPTEGEIYYPIAAAADVCVRDATTITVDGCQRPELFIPLLVQGKLIICTYTFEFEYESASIATVAETMKQVGAAGFIITTDPAMGSEQVKSTMLTLQTPSIVLDNMYTSLALWEYYNSHTVRGRRGQAVVFAATARILDGRQATYSGQAPIVAAYSSRGPDVNSALKQTVDVLKPNVLAPGSSIWAAWSPNSEGDQYIKGQSFALQSGTSMATPHIAGIAALIKQKHPKWSPAAITSAMMTTADRTDTSGGPILAQSTNQLAPATPFDFGAGSINACQAIEPGLIFNANFKHYVQFLCAVPGLDDRSLRRAVGVGCPDNRKFWCSDLNTASVIISNLVGSREVIREVTNVGHKNETYTVYVREPLGVNVTVVPATFRIGGNASRRLKLIFQATETTNAYTFGEMVLKSMVHTVRVPLAVYVSSVVSS